MAAITEYHSMDQISSQEFPGSTRISASTPVISAASCSRPTLYEPSSVIEAEDPYHDPDDGFAQRIINEDTPAEPGLAGGGLRVMAPI